MFHGIKSKCTSVANTVSFDLLPEAVKKLVTFAKLISLLNSFPCGFRDLGHPCLPQIIGKGHKPGHFQTLNSFPCGLKRFRAPLFARLLARAINPDIFRLSAAFHVDSEI